jgi:hypothetical protein
LVVILPAVWSKERERFKTLDPLAGFTAPVNWVDVAVALAEETVAAEGTTKIAVEPLPVAPDQVAEPAAGDWPVPEQQSPPPPPSPASLATPQPVGDSVRVRSAGPMIRLGLYGTRGGVGTSTAALTAAWALAAAGKRVALFDATQRGDLHLMAGLSPTEQPVVRERITFHLAPPTEEAIKGFDAAIVDGGRERGKFNAEWMAVSGHLFEERILRMVGIEPSKDKEGMLKSRETRRRTPQGGLGLGKLISIEVTE